MSDFESLPPLRDVIDSHGLRAKKALGQNFLLDLNLTQKIARQAGDLSGVTVFEIGPGPGGLTRALLETAAKKIIALEFDPRAVLALQELAAVSGGRLEVLQADALETDLLSLCPDGDRAILANLPYNIATPLLLGWLKQIRADRGAYRSMTLMFQKEVAQRITAPVGGKTYGRLSVVARWLCDVECKMDIPARAFTPPPKVVSSVVHFIPKDLPNGAPFFEQVESVTAAAFGQRRKMIRSSLKNYAHSFGRLGLDPESRAENLDVQDFIRLAAESEC